MSKESRCTGHCCRRVIVELSPYELARCKQSIENGTMKFELDDGSEYKHRYDLEEVTKVHAMLLWLGTTDEDPATGKQVMEKDGVTPHFEHIYTCRHFDDKSGDCLNYENRPNMCRVYARPERPCQYRECTSDCSARCVEEKETLQQALGINEITGVDIGHD